MRNSIQDVIEGHCPKCRAGRRANVVGEHVAKSTDKNGVWWRGTYRILKCCGCAAVYFQRSTVFSEDDPVYEDDPITGEWNSYLPEKIDYWPAPSKREKPEWTQLDTLDSVDPDLALLFDDIYVALNNDLRVLAAIGIRTVFDYASQLLDVDPAKNFADKLSDLESSGRIGRRDKEALELLVDAGSAAAHRGWKPKVGELSNMMTILETFLHSSFVIDGATKALKESIPPRKK